MVRHPETREQTAFITSRAGGREIEPTENTSPGGSDLAGCLLPVRGRQGAEAEQTGNTQAGCLSSHTPASDPTRSQQSGSGERGELAPGV